MKKIKIWMILLTFLAVGGCFTRISVNKVDAVEYSRDTITYTNGDVGVESYESVMRQRQYMDEHGQTMANLMIHSRQKLVYEGYDYNTGQLLFTFTDIKEGLHNSADTNFNECPSQWENYKAVPNTQLVYQVPWNNEGGITYAKGYYIDETAQNSSEQSSKVQSSASQANTQSQRSSTSIASPKNYSSSSKSNIASNNKEESSKKNSSKSSSSSSSSSESTEASSAEERADDNTTGKTIFAILCGLMIVVVATLIIRMRRR